MGTNRLVGDIKGFLECRTFSTKSEKVLGKVGSRTTQLSKTYSYFLPNKQNHILLGQQGTH